MRNKSIVVIASAMVRGICELYTDTGKITRENFLNDGSTRVAMAVYKDAKGQCYWTCEFAADR